MRVAVLIVSALMAAGCSDPPPPKPVQSIEKPIKQVDEKSCSVERLRTMIPKLAPLHDEFGPPKPGDWILSHEEDGQTFEQYMECGPVLPQGERTVLYVQPVGEFNAKQREIVNLSAEFMSIFFNLPVTIVEDVGLDVIPKDARRVHPSWGGDQILSTYVLYDVLKPRLPDDAAAYIAFTATDLWPGEGWNFVFGQASTRDRVGVWSLHRNGNPETEFELVLLRTLKTAVHETSHMFTLLHCTKYECNMCGCNSREEGDRRPLALCPECLAKVCWATKTDPALRYRKLIEFCKRTKLDDTAAFYEKLLKALEGVSRIDLR
ncbi:MAG: archaemetzincin [Planctomycetes bacterium]|nr:archaemetzincin [Planctomycetota bacterium]